MNEKDQDHELKHLVILDFDGTIFFNSNHNFSIDIPLGDVIDAHSFFSELTYQTGRFIPKNAEFILITGRNQFQKHFIIELLKAKGYKIDQAFFSQTQRTEVMDESTFLIEYWTAKAKLINQLSKDNRYESIIVIDDDPIVCLMSERINLEVYQAEFMNFYFRC
jgi:hypothetical protein